IGTVHPHIVRYVLGKEGDARVGAEVRKVVCPRKTDSCINPILAHCAGYCGKRSMITTSRTSYCADLAITTRVKARREHRKPDVVGLIGKPSLRHLAFEEPERRETVFDRESDKACRGKIAAAVDRLGRTGWAAAFEATTVNDEDRRPRSTPSRRVDYPVERSAIGSGGVS